MQWTMVPGNAYDACKFKCILFVSNGSKSERDWGWAYLLIPFSMVSSTNVDASCKNVRALALEKPEIAEDSESEDRRD